MFYRITEFDQIARFTHKIQSDCSIICDIQVDIHLQFILKYSSYSYEFKLLKNVKYD